jgi:hypothetical protein
LRGIIRKIKGLSEYPQQEQNSATYYRTSPKERPLEELELTTRLEDQNSENEIIYNDDIEIVPNVVENGGIYENE